VRDQLDEEVAATERNVIKDVSRKVYTGYTTRFLWFLFKSAPGLLKQEVVRDLQTTEDEGDGRKYFSQKLSTASSSSLIEFGDGNEFLQQVKRFIQSLEVGSSACQSAQSAIKNLLRDSGVAFSPAQEQSLQTFRRATKKSRAEKRQKEGGKLTEGIFLVFPLFFFLVFLRLYCFADTSFLAGKAVMSFALYQLLGQRSLQLAKKAGPFVHLVIVLCWNLACRVGNCMSVNIDHMCWVGDSLQVLFAQMKNDQEGEKSARFPRHIYANPLMPEVCPILALGLYFLLVPFDDGSVKLFPGDSQYNHFLELFKGLLSENQVKQQLESESLTESDIGAHSERKGAGTHLTSSIIDGASHVSVCLRLGWKLDGVTGRYLQHGSAGDQFVGRLLAGLPPHSPMLAILPPFFPSVDDDFVRESVQAIFPNFPLKLCGILRFCLASLSFHSDWLIKTLPQSHRLFSSSLFRDRNRLDRLKSLVVCRLHEVGDPFMPTGVNNSVQIMGHLERLSSEVTNLVQDVKLLAPSIAEATADRCLAMLESRADDMGTLTAQGMKNQVGLLRSELFSEMSALFEKHLGLAARAAGRSAEQGEGHANGLQSPLYTWNGRPQVFSADFDLPKGSVKTLFTEWFLGNTIRGYPPIRSALSADMKKPNSKKRLSDAKFLMSGMENDLRRLDRLVVHPSFEEVVMSVFV